MKTVLVTGANRGIGLELVQQLLAAGHQVLATCRSPESKGPLQDLALSHPDALDIFYVDVADEASVEMLAEDLEEKDVAIDWLINNAGVGDDAFGGDADRALMRKVFEVNAFAPLQVTQALYPFIKKKSAALVVQMSSLLGSVESQSSDFVGGYAYCGSKAALNMISKIMSIRFAEEEVACIALSPGWVQTDMGGMEAHLTPNESVGSILSLLSGLTLADSGKFFHYDGSELPW